MNNFRKKLPGTPYFFWSVLFIIIPLCMVFYYPGKYHSSHNKGTQQGIMALAPSVPDRNCDLSAALLPACHDPVQQKRRPAQRDRIYLHPSHVMNFLLRTLAWQTLLEKTGVINSILSFLHLPALNIINTPQAIVLGMVYNFLPFMVLPIYNALVKIDENVINAARDLGASPVQVFFKVMLPLTLPGIISGITMVFIPALTTFVISNLLGGSKVLLIGNVVEQEFTQASNWHLGSGLSIVLMLFILLNMIVSAIFDKEGEGSVL